MIPDREPVNTWDGNSSNTTFDFDFLINSKDELLVLHTDKAGMQNTLKLNIDYTIHQTGNADGSYIIFPILGSSYKTLGDGEKITLMLNIPIAQTSPYGTSAKLNLKSLEYSLDYIVRLIQIVNRKVNRSVKVQEASDIKPDELIQNIYDTMAAANNSVAKIENLTRQAQSAAAFAQRTCFYEIITDSFVTTGTQQDFTLSKTADSINEILGVNINNHNLLKSKYSLKNEKTVSLISPVEAGCEIAITYLSGKLAPIGSVFTNFFEFEQASPSEVWKINHKLARFPQVTIVDSSGRVVSGEVKYVDNMNVEVYFNGGFSGKAYLV